MVLSELVKARRGQHRLPPLPKVADAWRFLFRSLQDNSRLFTRNEVYLATEVFRHLTENEDSMEEDAPERLSEDDIKFALQSLAQTSTETSGRNREHFRSDESALARLMYEQVRFRYQRKSQNAVANDELHTLPDSAELLRTYALILARTGDAKLARQLLKKSEAASKDTLKDGDRADPWHAIIIGYIREGDLDNAKDLFASRQRDGKLRIADQEDILLVLAKGGHFGPAMSAFSRMYEPDGPQDHLTLTNMIPTIYSSLIDLCIRCNSTDYGNRVHKIVVRKQVKQKLQRAAYVGPDILWRWYKSDEPKVNHAVLIQDALRHFAFGWEDFNMPMLNPVLSYAFAQDKPEDSIAFLDAVESKGYETSPEITLIQLDFYSSKHDYEAAAQHYNQYCSEELVHVKQEAGPLNRYVVSMCQGVKPDRDQIMRVVDHLLDRSADLTAETLASLCQFFLQRDDLEEITGLLRYRSELLPDTDRAQISQVFQQFILNPSIQDQRAYNAYDLFRRAFSETPVPARIALMQSFFSRKRPDLACLVFGHMRQRDRADQRPDALAYAKAFEGIAAARDVDGMQMIYNMLKLDLLVEPETRIRNAMMHAYTMTYQPWSAIVDSFWKVMDSRSGPTMSTFILALRACETWVPYGALEARNVMALVQRYDVEVTKELYDAYIGALAGQSEFENTIELIEEMEKDTGFVPDVMTIGTFYNAIPWQWRKDEVEAWAKRVYPELWEELLTVGDEVDEEWEVRYFKIDRSVEMDDGLLFEGEKGYEPRIAREVVLRLEAPNR